MKKIILFLTFVIFVLIFSGCSKNDNNLIKIKKENKEICITLSSSLSPSSELNEELKSANFKEVSKNSDKSVSYYISEKDYNKFIKTLSDDIQEDMKKLSSKNNENFLYISLDNDYKTLTVKLANESIIEKNSLEINSIVTEILLYKSYSGKKATLTVDYINNKTNKTITKKDISL